MKNLVLWVLMMFVPLVSLLAHLLMKTSGNYQSLLSRHDLDEFRIAKPLIYYGRGIFVAILLAFWLLAIGMFAEAYVNYRKKRATSLKTEDAEQLEGKVKLSILWILTTIFTLLPMCIPNLVPHIVYNLLIVVALTITALAYRNHVRYIRARESGRLA